MESKSVVTGVMHCRHHDLYRLTYYHHNLVLNRLMALMNVYYKKIAPSCTLNLLRRNHAQTPIESTRKESCLSYVVTCTYVHTAPEMHTFASCLGQAAYKLCLAALCLLALTFILRPRCTRYFLFRPSCLYVSKA